MRILILSLSRSASTAIYYDVMRSTPTHCEGYFEPDIKSFLTKDLSAHATAKIILDHLEPDDLQILLGKFDKIILTIRDPRDRLISAMLFAMHGVEKSLFLQRLAELEIKRQHPERYPFLDLVENIFKGWHRNDAVNLVQRHFALLVQVLSTVKTLKIIRYENYIRQGLAGVFENVLMTPDTELEIPERHSYGKRKVAQGDWKNWFTPSDVTFLKPGLTKYLLHFDYLDEWQLNIPQLILPEHSTEFVLSAYEKDQTFKQQGITWQQS